MPVCKVDDCQKLTTPKSARGYCQLHYGRFIKHDGDISDPTGRLMMSRSRIYKLWHSMVSRCHNPKITHIGTTGGKNIRVCDEWRGNDGFIKFMSDMKPTELSEYSLDRIDGNKGYSKDNCRWATTKQQVVNRSLNANNRCGFKGVYFDTHADRYRAMIMNDSQRIYLGTYKDKGDAAIAYDCAAIQLHGEDANLNTL